MNAPPDEWTFHVDQLVKHFGTVAANDGITLQVEPGEVYGLLGPNGAGKSTLVKQTIGLLKPTSGQITLGRWDLVENPDAARQLCSYLPQAQMPIDSFRVREAIELAGPDPRRRDRPGPPPDRTSSSRRSSSASGADTSAPDLSGGVKRLVGFCMATISPGHLVILDEPTNDVDPLRRRLLWDEIRALGAHGCSVLLVTHNVLEAEKAVDRLALIAQRPPRGGGNTVLPQGRGPDSAAPAGDARAGSGDARRRPRGRARRSGSATTWSPPSPRADASVRHRLGRGAHRHRRRRGVRARRPPPWRTPTSG